MERWEAERHHFKLRIPHHKLPHHLWNFLKGFFNEFLLGSGRLGEDIGGEVFSWLLGANSYANPRKRFTDVIHDRAQAIMRSRATRWTQARFSESEINVVREDENGRWIHFVEVEEFFHGFPGTIHIGLGFHEQNRHSHDSRLHDRGEKFLLVLPGLRPECVRKKIECAKAGIMTSILVLLPRIAKTHNDKRGFHRGILNYPFSIINFHLSCISSSFPR